MAKPISLRNLKHYHDHHQHHHHQQRSFPFTWVRRAEPEDVAPITNLANKQTKLLFGDISIKNLVTQRFVTLVLEDWRSSNKIIGAITLEGWPNVPSIPPWEWQSWIFNIYRLSALTPWNSLFLHLMVYDEGYESLFLKPLLTAAFWRFHSLEYIVMTMPPIGSKVEWIERISSKIVPHGVGSDPKKVQTVYLMMRDQFMTKYKVRKAVVEDNDDIVPLIHSQCTRLKELYGEYYIAEILSKEESESERRIIVAEHEGHAVAVLCLNLTVNVETLNDHFELIPFKGLRKDEITSESGEDVDDESVGYKRDMEDAVEGEHSSYGSREDAEESGVLGVDLTDSVSIAFSNLTSESLLSILTPDNASKKSETSLKSSESTEILDILNVSYYRKATIPGSELFNYRTNLLAKGEPNSFALEIAAAHPNHEDALPQLIEAAFQCIPDRDYCVLTFPSTTPNTPMFNLFVKVSPKTISNYEHDLYVLHKNAISSTMSVRWAQWSDLDKIQTMAKSLHKSERTIETFEEALGCEDEEMKCFIFCAGRDTIGFAVVSNVTDTEYLTTHYDVFAWVDRLSIHKESFGLVEYFCVMPVFHMYVGFFLREMHRMSDCFAFFYTLTHRDTLSMQRQRHLSGCLTHMMPVRGVVLVDLNNALLEEMERPNKAVLRQDIPYSLYCSTIRINGISRAVINLKIVVVGESNCGLSFLHALVLTHCPYFHMTFSNLTLVTPHGMSFQRAPNKVRDMMFVTSSHFNHRFVCNNALRTHVNICQGVMTGIDRKDKHITLNDNTTVPYDLLFLFCGQQHQIWKGPKNEYPENVFIINGEADAANALNKLRHCIPVNNETRKFSICVYGHELEAYCCLASLLEYGIPGENIIFVEPFPIDQKRTPPHTYSFFNNKDVDDAVVAEIKNAGITVHSSFVFNRWTYNSEKKRISSAHFQSKHHKLDVECSALFLYMAKDISRRTFLAINRAGLVYDGRLVIQSDCRTNDPCIYAAGTMTKYSRRFYADHLTHRYYNMCEIGDKLGHQIRRMLITEYKHPEHHERQSTCRSEKMQVPSYWRPLMKYCRLPGGLRYLHVRKPGKEVPLVTAMASNDYGNLIVTGDTNDLTTRGWFRIHVNKYNTVETITCLAPFYIDYTNLASLWGKHVKLLNNLVERYEMGYIDDLYNFFREPWASALFHEKFDVLEYNMRDLLSSYTEEEGNSLIEDVYRIFQANNWKPMSTDQHKEITDKFLKSEYHTRLKQLLLDFILDNMKALPMYAHPVQIAEIMQGNENSPFFKRMYKR